MAFLEGYAVGLALIVLIGPVLFVLVGATLAHGKASGFAVAAGIFASDVLAVAICALGFAGTLLGRVVAPWIGIGGGVLLLGFGVRYLLATPPDTALATHPSASTLAAAFVKGFLVNFVNPFVFMVWLAIIAAAGTRHGLGANLVWFLSGSVLAVLTLDSLKVVLAERIKRALTPATLKWAFRGSGTLLCLFGVRLMVTGWR